MIYNLFIQSLAIIAVIIFILSFHRRSRKNILVMQIISLIIWSIHYFLLSAWTGTIILIINLIITFIFIFKSKLKNNFVLYLSLSLLLIVTIISWEKYYSLFPFLAVSSITIAKWQNKLFNIRLISIPASIFWIIYDSFVGAYGSIIAEILIIISIIASLITYKR